MNVHDWHRNGLEPAFATIEQWINDQLGYLGVEDEACFAIEIRPETDRAGLAVRILIATDDGLFDMRWERPKAVDRRQLTSQLYPWAEVRGAQLLAETRIDRMTLMHGEPTWGLEFAVPQILIAQTDVGVALLEFWQACAARLKKVNAR